MPRVYKYHLVYNKESGKYEVRDFYFESLSGLIANANKNVKNDHADGGKKKIELKYESPYIPTNIGDEVFDLLKNTVDEWNKQDFVFLTVEKVMLDNKIIEILDKKRVYATVSEFVPVGNIGYHITRYQLLDDFIDKPKERQDLVPLDNILFRKDREITLIGKN